MMSWACDFDFEDNVNVLSKKPGYSKGQQLKLLEQSTSSDAVNIADLVQGFLNCQKVIGIVIAKEEPRTFRSKKDPSCERFLLSFTLRDTPAAFVNVTCWGGEDYINDLSQQFHIGDVVEMMNVNIQNKATDGSDEKFRPWTSSAYNINLGEKNGSLKVVTEWYLSEYSHIQHIPTKPHNDFYTIADIISNGQNLVGEYINILTIVKQVGCPKEITTKLGKRMTRCEVKLFDESNSNLDLTIWDKELALLAAGWSPRDHVLFVADVRVAYNNYKKYMVVTATSKTVVTVNPDTKEAHKLYQYAQTADITEAEPMDVSYTDAGQVNLDSIQDVYSIEGVKTASEGGDVSVPIYGILYSVITTMDIDADSFSIIAVRCTRCRYRVNDVSGRCVNQNCVQGNAMELNEQTTDTGTEYDLRLAISDHTGTFTGCKVNPEVVTAMMNCTPQDFQYLSEEQRTSLKWGFLLERCKIYFKLFPAAFERSSSFRILSCERAKPDEVVKSL